MSNWQTYINDLEIPENWEDVTWHNNELPSYIANGYYIWVNAPKMEERKENYTSNGYSLNDYEDWRFAVQVYNEADGEIVYPEDGSDPDVLRTLDFDEVIKLVND